MNGYFKPKFWVLLLTLLLLLVVQPVVAGFSVGLRWFDVFFSLVVLACVYALCQEKRHRVFAWLFGIPPLLIVWFGHALSGVFEDRVMMLGHLFGVLFFCFAALMTVRAILQDRQITLDSILGAICGYLLLGVAWGLSYAMLDSLQPESFQIDHEIAEHFGATKLRLHSFVYYSFTTLTTLGYGDVTPVSPTAKTLAWIEAVMGQFYMAVLVAGIVGVLVSRAIGLGTVPGKESRSEP